MVPGEAAAEGVEGAGGLAVGLDEGVRRGRVEDFALVDVAATAMMVMLLWWWFGRLSVVAMPVAGKKGGAGASRERERERSERD